MLVNLAPATLKYTYDVETTGSRMRAIRERRGLTLVQVAEVLGISESALSQIERGVTKNVRPAHFLKWCAHFGEDPYYIVFGKPRKLVEREANRGGGSP